MQELERIFAWTGTNESHEYCNTFCLVIICDGTDDGQLFDCNGERFSSISEITEEIVSIGSLEGKAKLILFQRCIGITFTGFKFLLGSHLVPSIRIGMFKSDISRISQEGHQSVSPTYNLAKCL